jgi:Flp pilus assembly protein TadG
VRRLKSLLRDSKGAAVVEMAFALPSLIVLLWMVVQLGLVFRAMSGIQHSLGEGARAATLYPYIGEAQIREKMNAAVYGVGPGTFNIPTPQEGAADGSTFLDLSVTYTQQTDLLLLPGPTISVTRSKRVWIADDD